MSTWVHNNYKIDLLKNTKQKTLTGKADISANPQAGTFHDLSNIRYVML